jgi:hypothetical protein
MAPSDGRSLRGQPCNNGELFMGQIQYIADEHNNITGVIVPIDLWREIQSEKETAYLLKSEAMKKRLLDAKKRKKGIPFDEACKKLGV